MSWEKVESLLDGGNDSLAFAAARELILQKSFADSAKTMARIERLLRGPKYLHALRSDPAHTDESLNPKQVARCGTSSSEIRFAHYPQEVSCPICEKSAPPRIVVHADDAPCDFCSSWREVAAILEEGDMGRALTDAGALLKQKYHGVARCAVASRVLCALAFYLKEAA